MHLSKAKRPRGKRFQRKVHLSLKCTNFQSQTQKLKMVEMGSIIPQTTWEPRSGHVDLVSNLILLLDFTAKAFPFNIKHT